MDCGFPRWVIIMVIPNAIFFFGMFSEFYNRAYKQKMEREQTRALVKSATLISSQDGSHDNNNNENGINGAIRSENGKAKAQ